MTDAAARPWVRKQADGFLGLGDPRNLPWIQKVSFFSQFINHMDRLESKGGCYRLWGYCSFPKSGFSGGTCDQLGLWTQEGKFEG